ncbi:MAG TPA: hypothetical protein DCG77_19565 [Sphingobacterium sp.]|nr:hypothetical protein [Sphingobacterium sp.]
MLNNLSIVKTKGAHHCVDDTNMHSKASDVNSFKQMRGNTVKSDGKCLKTVKQMHPSVCGGEMPLAYVILVLNKGLDRVIL